MSPRGILRVPRIPTIVADEKRKDKGDDAKGIRERNVKGDADISLDKGRSDDANAAGKSTIFMRSAKPRHKGDREKYEDAILVTVSVNAYAALCISYAMP